MRLRGFLTVVITAVLVVGAACGGGDNNDGDDRYNYECDAADADITLINNYNGHTDCMVACFSVGAKTLFIYNDQLTGTFGIRGSVPPSHEPFSFLCNHIYFDDIILLILGMFRDNDSIHLDILNLPNLPVDERFITYDMLCQFDDSNVIISKDITTRFKSKISSYLFLILHMKNPY